MSRPASLIDIVTRWRWFRIVRIRRLVFALLIVVLALLVPFLRVYVGNVKVAPQDTDTAGLHLIVAQLGGNHAALLGQHEPVEIDLAFGRSFEVRRDIARKIGLIEGNSAASIQSAIRKLDRLVDVRALRAGIQEIEVTRHDPDEVDRANPSIQ